MADPVLTRHCSLPVAVSSAYKVPSVLPTYRVLPITTGRLFTGDPLSWCDHRVEPSAVFSATIVPPVGMNSVDEPSARSAVMAAGSVTCQVTVHCCRPAGSALTSVSAAWPEVPAALRPM